MLRTSIATVISVALIAAATASPTIFQIGFNKAATSSLYMFMKHALFPVRVIHG